MSAAAASQVAAAGAAVSVVAGARAFMRAGPSVGSANALKDARGVRRLRAGRRLEIQLARAGAPMGPDLFVGAVVALAVVCGLVLWRGFGSPLAAITAVAGAALGVRAFLRSAERRYVHRVAAQLPGVAQLLASGVSAGLSLRQALQRAAEDAPQPVAAELRMVTADLALGTRVEDALDAFAARLPDPDLAVMVTAILIQRRTGGRMARALGELSERLEERTALSRELRGATAQARATAWIVAGLPLAGALLLELAAPGLVGRTLGTGPGLVLVAAAALLQGAGILLVRRIARIES